MSKPSYPRLMITGPVDVRKEILDAQTHYMIGHRGKGFEELFARLQGKLRQAFKTEHRVYVLGSSGTGFWEAASRNAIRDDKKVLHLVAGAFSERWAEISELNGKQVDTITLEWGKAHTPEMVEEALKKATYDAVCVVHNETSTGVTNPIKEIGQVIRQYSDDTLFMVDTVSGLLGTEFLTDEWGVDFALTSSQKAFALPPGLAFAAVSDRVLERAKTVKNRGYYFDLIEMEKSLVKNNTPSTPPVSLMFAADAQMDAILSEGIENRWARHKQMKEMTHSWALSRDFGLYAQEGYRSNTVTTVDNTRNMNVDDMASFMKGKGYVIDKGYGKIKGKTFRVGHMGDVTPDMLEEVFAGIDEFLGV